MSRNSRQRRFIRAAVLPAAVACVAMLSIGGVLMQTGCGPAPTPIPTPSAGGGGPSGGQAPSVQVSSQLVTGTDGSYTVTLNAEVVGNLIPPYTYAWSYEQFPRERDWTREPLTGATITNATSATATAVITLARYYYFYVTVTDKAGKTVVEGTYVNVPPLSVSTNSPLYVSRTQTATLTATTTGGFGAKTYLWIPIRGPNGAPATPFAATTTVPTTVLGTTYYAVGVTDSATPANTASAFCTVVVTPLPMTVTASATPATLTLPSTAMLSCTVNEGGPPYSFSWLQTGGGRPAIIDSSSAQNTIVRFSDVGTYTFCVYVLDDIDQYPNDSGWTAFSSFVTVTVASTSVAFTTSPLDSLVGSSGSDTFTATNTTLQSSDTANGGDGTDTLTISLAAALNTALPTLSSIETINISDVSAQGSTLNAQRVSGLTTLNFLAPVAAETVTNLNSIPAVGVSNDASAVTLTFKDDIVSGPADALTMTLNNIAEGVYDIDNNASGTSSIETVNLVSTGGANTLTLVQGPATINVTGDQPLRMTAPNSATTINASGMTAGGVAVTLGTGNVTFTGSPADDTVDDANYTTSDILSGGLGTDTLMLADEDASVTVAQSNVTGFETLYLTNGMTDDVISSYWGAITTVVLTDGIDAAKTLSVPTGTTIELNETSTSIGAAVIQVPGSSTTDSVTVKIKGAFAMASTTDFSRIETVNVVADANATFTGAVSVNTAGANRVLNLSGASGKTVTFGGAVTANVINGSALTGALTMSAATVAPLGAAITGGSGADVLYGSTSADTITTGAGATNTVYAGAGADIIICGSGVDTIKYVTTVDGAEIVQAFTPGTGGDVFDTDFAPTTGFGTITTVTPAAGAVTLATAGAAVFSVAIPLVTPTDFTNMTQVRGAVSGTSVSVSADQNKCMLILYSGGDAYLYEIAESNGDGDATVAATDITLVATFENVAASSFVAANIQ